MRAVFVVAIVAAAVLVTATAVLPPKVLSAAQQTSEPSPGPAVSNSNDAPSARPMGRDEPTTTTPSVSQPRPLEARVHTETGGYYAEFFSRANSVIRAPRAYALNGTLVLEFDAQKVAGAATGRTFLNGPSPLLIRLFDHHGQYLRHFFTTEWYSPDDEEIAYVRRYHEAGAAWNRKYAAEHIAALTRLKPTGNRLVYPVNQRDLDYTAYVEVGFWIDPRTGDRGHP